MNLDKYTYVKAVADCRSFSQAADKLYISQPALTKSISKLESELGVKLFDRSNQPIKLTYAGERYLEYMSNICAMATQLTHELDEIATMKKESLTVGVPGTRGARWFPSILPVFLRDFPNINLRVVDGSTGALEQALAHEEVDLVVFSSLPQMVPGLDYETLYDEPLMLISSTKHSMFKDIDLSQAMTRRAALHYIPPASIDNQPFISTLPDQGLHRAASLMFRQFSVHPRTITSISHIAMANVLAADGLGFTIAPTDSALSKRLSGHNYVFCTISDPPKTRTIISTYKRRRQLSPAALRFLEITRNIVNENKSTLSYQLPVLYDIEGL